MTGKVKLTNICPVFVTDDVIKTTEYYVNTLGFKYARHFDKADKFATLYRDAIEIVVVQKLKGIIQSNIERYGNGFDAYIDTDTVEGVDIIYKEYQEKKVKIVTKPRNTDYGSYEFTFEDVDGRIIGIGLIENNDQYFEDSNLLEGDR
jgi:predicted lactoylglutathione lyase